MRKAFLVTLAAAMLCGSAAFAQEAKKTMFNGSTNIQIFYDLAPDRNFVTTTVEGFYNDPWGNTFFFIDHDFPVKGDAAKSPAGTYWEIARCFNFWQNTKASFFSLQLEYNGGAYKGYGINHAILAGTDFFVHSKDFRNTFNFKLLYKHIFYNDNHISMVPLQFTFVWGMQDLFGAKGLRFSGFLDIWGEDTKVYPYSNAIPGVDYGATGEDAHVVLISEPQLWYSVGQHFGCPNLNIGTELELSWNFANCKNFMARPCLGVKWVF